MARYKQYNYDQLKLLPISFSRQILPGTFEYTLSRWPAADLRAGQGTAARATVFFVLTWLVSEETAGYAPGSGENCHERDH